MTVLQDLQKLSAAEEIFDYLGVAYDPAVLNVNRLHILRLAGNWLRDESLAELEDGALRDRFKGLVEKAYAELGERGPLEQRLFKVHKDAVREAAPAPKPAFVPLSDLK